ncbi:MAG: prepilin-type N-terminal cleavage/methylation domain-containing protein [Tepidisphaeraceae bacterium]
MNSTEQTPKFDRRRASAAPQLATGNWQLATSRAFTLTEILVTVAIIVLVLALGVPVFSALRGTRSTEAGLNQVSAVIGQARTIAINEGTYAGVLFFVDPRNRRTSLAIVTIADPTDDPDPYDKYKGWQGPQATGWPASGAAQDYQAGNTTANPPQLADRVIRLAQDRAAGGNVAAPATYPPTPLGATQGAATPSHIERALLAFDRPVVRMWRAQEDNTSATANAPTQRDAGNNNTAFINQWWGSALGGISLYRNSEFVLLPEGVGAQLIVQGLREGATGNVRDEFVGLGVIAFDPSGNMTFRTFNIDKDSTIGQLLNLTADALGVPAGVGIAVYDQVNFRDRGYTDRDYVAADQSAAGAAVVYGTPASTILTAPPDWNSSTNSEFNEETWLKQNATPFFINRYSGTVSQGN